MKGSRPFVRSKRPSIGAVFLSIRHQAVAGHVAPEDDSVRPAPDHRDTHRNNPLQDVDHVPTSAP